MVSAASYPSTTRRPTWRSRLRERARLAGVGLALALVSACASVPITGRSTVNLFSVSDDVQLGRQAYQDLLAQERVVTGGSELEMVRRVMNRLVAVADDAGYEWEVNLLDAPDTVNAFALPGGKMAVYTGILPVCQSEAGLAVVMGHEIAHVVARHGTERVTNAYGVEVALALLNVGDYEELARMAVSLVFELPYGRKHESEADRIGLIYMARAGYDPEEAVRFWSRMAEGTGAGPPEFLSTHPSHETRIENLRGWLPEARAELP